MENTKIAWATHTLNPWIGCQKVHAGCLQCYAEELMANRYKKVIWGPNGTRRLASASKWREPVRWNKAAAGLTERPRVFCASLADVFEDWQGPIVNAKGETLCAGGEAELPMEMDDVRRQLFAMIDATPNLDWLLLTKRPENIRRMWPDVEPSSRAICYPGGAKRGAGDHAGRDGLAAQEADLRSLDGRHKNDAMRAGSGRGDDELRLSTGSANAGRSPVCGLGSPASIPSLQGGDPPRPNGESQGWGESKLPPGQSGAGYLQRAAAPRDPSSRDQSGRPEASSYRSNVWLLTSPTDQKTFDAAWPHLAKCRDLVPVLGLSAEPLTGPINLLGSARPDWVIVGGESGRDARPCAFEWLLDLQEQCRKAEVPCFIKQAGSKPVTTNANLLDWLDDEPEEYAWGTGAASCGYRLKDPKGGDPDEWPLGLRSRQFPAVARA